MHDPSKMDQRNPCILVWVGGWVSTRFPREFGWIVELFFPPRLKQKTTMYLHCYFSCTTGDQQRPHTFYWIPIRHTAIFWRKLPSDWALLSTLALLSPIWARSSNNGSRILWKHCKSGDQCWSMLLPGVCRRLLSCTDAFDRRISVSSMRGGPASLFGAGHVKKVGCRRMRIL